MIAVKRLSAALCVFATVGVVAACASPTDEEITQGTPRGTTEEATDDATEDTDQTSSAISEDDEGYVGDDVRGEVSSAIHDDFRGRRCDRRDNFHCRRGHRGWRWVRDRHRPSWHGPGWHGHDRPDRDRYCCVRTFH